MSDDFLRIVAAKLGYDFDDTNLKKFLDGTSQASSQLKDVAQSYGQMAKASKGSGQKQAADESKRLTLEGKELTNENKRLGIEIKKGRLEAQQQSKAWKDLTLQGEKLKQEVTQLRKQKLEDDFKRQDSAAKKTANSIETLKRGLMGLAAIKISEWGLQIATNMERAQVRLAAWTDQRALKRLETQFETLNKQTNYLFNKKQFEASAQAVLAIDKSTRRFSKSLGYAVAIAPHLKMTLEEIQMAAAEGVLYGNTGALEQMGILNQIDLVKMQKQSGVSFSDLTFHEREKMVFDAMQSFINQLPEGGDALDGIISNMGRLNTVIYEIGRTIGEDYKPQANFILKHVTNLFRLMKDSPVGMFALKVAGSIGGLAAFGVSVLAVAKAFQMLKSMIVSVNKATLILMAKFIAIGVAILAVILVVEDLWMSLKDPEADTVFNSLFKKFPKLRKIITNLFKSITMLWDVIKSWLTFWATGELPEWLQKLDKMIPGLIEPLKTVQKLFRGLFDEVTNLLAGDFENSALIGLIDKIGQVGGSFLNFFTGEDSGQTRGGTPGISGLSTQSLQSSTVNQSTSNQIIINTGNRKYEVRSGLSKEEALKQTKELIKQDRDKELNEIDMAFGVPN